MVSQYRAWTSVATLLALTGAVIGIVYRLEVQSAERNVGQRSVRDTPSILRIGQAERQTNGIEADKREKERGDGRATTVKRSLRYSLSSRKAEHSFLSELLLDGAHLESLFVGMPKDSDVRVHTAISDTVLEHISRLPKLRQLCLSGAVSRQGFQQLSKLRTLRRLGCDRPAIGAKDVFAVVSKLPEIRSLSIRWADFSQPIDDETYQAIASLNGRLESLDFGEWGETTIHPSMIPAIAEIRSLTWLELGNFIAAYEDFEPIRRKLVYLDHLGPTVRELEGIQTTDNCCWKPNDPICTSTVDSPAEMQCLLRNLLGTIQANDIRREVVRRRIGKSPEQDDAADIRISLSDVLENSFGVELKPDAQETLRSISRENPRLELQMRRYLSGTDMAPAVREAQ